MLSQVLPHRRHVIQRWMVFMALQGVRGLPSLSPHRTWVVLLGLAQAASVCSKVAVGTLGRTEQGQPSQSIYQ